MSSKRILFINDGRSESTDAKSLAGELGGDMQSTIVPNGVEALGTLEKTPHDFVISELILPDMNAAQLLKEISSKYPATIRIVMSGHTDRELIMQTLESAHQFIAAPCSAGDLRKILENSLGLRELLDNRDLHARIATVRALPSPPEIYQKLVSELNSEHASVQKVAALIEKDVAITAKLLQMVNSAFFGLPAHVKSPLHAVRLLGLETVKGLVLAAGVFDQFQDPKLPGFSLSAIQTRSVAVGTGAKHLAGAFGLDKNDVDDALLAGMLHEVGKLVMVTNFREELTRSLKLAEQKSIPLHQAEEEVMGVGHAEIGAHLLSIWGLPHSILEAVAFHQTPERVPGPMINVLTTVHIAYAVEHDSFYGVKDPRDSAIRTEYLETLGLAEQLPNLKHFCVS